jgi:hypothetical protein
MVGILKLRVIISGFSVCHWPGGQLRVSNAGRICGMAVFAFPAPP